MSNRPLARALLVCAITVGIVQSLPPVAARAPCALQAKECNIPYVRGGQHRHQVLDVYYLSRTARVRRPALIFVHGGGWWGGDKADMANPVFNGPVHAAQFGWVAFNIDYRLAQNTFARGVGDSAKPYLEQPLDIASAINWVKRHAKTYSIDPNRIALIGASAGAHLALLTAFSHSAAHDPLRVKVVVSWAGPTNMAALANEHPCLKSFDGTCNPLTDSAGPPMAEMIRRFEGGCTVDQCASRYMSTSPVNKVTGQAPPTLLVQGIFDSTVPAEQAAELQAQLSAHHVPVESAGCAVVDVNGLLLPCNHFTLASSVWQPTIKFLRQRL